MLLAQIDSFSSRTMSVLRLAQNNGSDAYRAWKLAKEALFQSIDLYINSCDALASISFDSVVLPNMNEDAMLPDALAIDAELSGLAHQEHRLQNARFSLLASRNKSKCFSKINSLPIEILSCIFLAANPYSKDCGSWRSCTYPTTLASVCQLWRKMILELPSIWSFFHIRINKEAWAGSEECAKLWIDRSRSHPLYLQMLQPKDDSVIGFSYNLASRVSVIAPRVQHFVIQSSRCVMQDMLCCLINNGTPGSMQALELEDLEGTNSNHLLSWRAYATSPAPPQDCTEAYLSSIQALKLRFTFFPWYSTAYENLSSLSLNLSTPYLCHVAPTQSEMAKILASSPMLVILELTLESSCRN